MRKVQRWYGHDCESSWQNLGMDRRDCNYLSDRSFAFVLAVHFPHDVLLGWILGPLTLWVFMLW